MESKSFKQKISGFFSKYGYFVLLGVLVLAVIITSIVASSVNKGEDKYVDTNATVSAYMPVLNATIYKDYYSDELAFNSTLNQWETHKAIDFQVASGSNVYSILDGVVKDVYTNILEGTVVTIEHNDGLTSTYGSLDSELDVEVGDSISRGDVIGVVSASATSESDAGAHLHFAMSLDGEKIDPASYLNITNK